MLTVDQITANIITQLQILDPTASAEVGTPERKIIEAVAEMVAGSQVDLTVLNQQHDLDSMAGGRLDAYLSIYNFGRQQGTPSNGIVTFGRDANALTAIVIPIGTQVQAIIPNNVLPSVGFVTVQTTIIEAGQASVNCPVQCTVAGTIGNIDANKITGFGGLQSITGVSSVTNLASFSGGTDTETDAAYKARFQNSFLRNISGTTDMFLALAVSATSVSKANVVGPISRYQEYIQVPDAADVAQNTLNGYDDQGVIFPHKRTSAQSTIPYSKFTYPVNFYVTNGTLDPATAIFFKHGVDFVFNTPPISAANAPQQMPAANPTQPNLTFLNPFDVSSNLGGNILLTGETVVLLEHAYMSISSRNNYNFGILNSVDVFVDGEQIAVVSSIEVVPGSFNDIQSTSSKLWTYQILEPPKVINFRRKIDGAPCPVGNRIQPLYWQPVTDLPDLILVGDSTYYKANFYNPVDGYYYNSKDPDTGDYILKAHYALVEEVNSYYGTIRARNGIEWFLTGQNYLPGQSASDDPTSGNYGGSFIDSQAGTQFLLDSYFYDSNVSDLQAIMEKNKQTTQDVLVHKAKFRYFRPMITVMYSLGANKSIVDASILAVLSNFFRNAYYGSAIQLSDILQAIHNTPGVDNVRWTNDIPGGHKLEEVGANGSSLFDGPYWITDDFFIQDDQLAASPSDHAADITVRAQNTWQLG